MKSCDNSKKLTIHHVVPRAFGRHELKLPIDKINSIINGITLCRGCHKLIHDGFKYGQDRIYWDTRFDNFFKKTAWKNTFQFVTKQINKRKVVKHFNGITMISTEALEVIPTIQT